MALSSDVLPIFITLQKIFDSYESHREKNQVPSSNFYDVINHSDDFIPLQSSCDPSEAKALRDAIRRHCAIDDSLDPVFGKLAQETRS